MGLTSIINIEYVCDKCGKRQKCTTMFNCKNVIGKSMIEPGIVCHDCMKSIRGEKHRGITIEEHSIKHMAKRRTNNKPPLKLRDYSGKICDLMEDLLDRYGICIPDDNRECDPDEACLFGDNYCNLEDGIVDLLEKLVKEIKSDPTVTIDKDNL